jgi:hypothetical protein
MASMERKDRRFLQKKSESENVRAEGEVVIPAAAEHRDLLDLALSSVDAGIVYPSPIEWRQLTQRVSQDVCAPHAAIEAIVSRTPKAAISVPDASEWAALSRAVRQRVSTRKSKSPVLRPFFESLRTLFVPVGVGETVLAFILIFGIFVVAAMTYADLASVATQADANFFQPIANRTTEINELIRGNVMVAAAMVSEDHHLEMLEQGRG